jgi:Big-like domain-containing protein
MILAQVFCSMRVTYVAAVVALPIVICVSDAKADMRPTDPFTFGNPAFCAPKELVNDFGISELPSVREAPPLGDLPFGPKTVSLGVSAGPVLRIGEDTSFRLHSENYVGRTPLRWILRNRIRSVSEAGEAGSVVARGRKRVRIINAATEVKLYLDPPRIPGFFLYEIEILKFDGAPLATYSSYLRVERSFWDARLGLSRYRVRPGQRVLSRVENFGTEWIYYGEAFGVQRLQGEAWVDAPSATPDGWLLWAGMLGPGSPGRCSGAYLPRILPPGQYRIVKEVEQRLGPEKDRVYELTAPFEVLA